ncbi:MAG TPA: hypothetical protein VIK63_01575, partial [Haloplasmataceae bacterium]
MTLTIPILIIELKEAKSEQMLHHADANRYTFIWHGWVEKHEAKLQEKVRALFYQIEEELSLTFYYPLNVQVGMEGGYVIGVDIYHYTTDMPTLIPFIRKVQQDYHGVIQNVVADSGYASE